MSNDAREGQNRGERDREGQPAEDDSFEARLRRARERRRADAGSGPRPPGGTDASALARGFRLSSELVGAVLLGGAIGWLLDRWLGISPWGMIVFLLLGFAAGVLNVMRAAGIVPPQTMHPPSQD
jgi:ATP synthase protein I